MALTTSSEIPRTERRFHWGAGALAGLIAGLVFLMAEMMLVWLVYGQSSWGPPRMIAAMVMGKEVLPPPATFDLVVVMVAMAIHFTVSILLGLVGALLFGRLGLAAAAALGVAFGLVIYYVNFYPIADALFPWFAEARNGVSIFSHALFGLVLGVAYVMCARPRPAAS